MKSFPALIGALSVLVLASACGTSMPRRDKNPELARRDGYFTSRENATARGGVSNYVPQYCSQGGWGLPADCGAAPATTAAIPAVAQKVARIADRVATTAAAPAAAKPALLKVYFESGKSTLAKSELAKVQNWASSFAESSPNAAASRSLELRGFADSSGNVSKNQSLSQARAEQTAAVLRKAGLNAKVTGLQGMGAVSQSASGAQAREARRVEIVLE